MPSDEVLSPPAVERSSLYEASFYEKLSNGRLLCTLCPHDCKIAEGRRGACGVRVNHKGVLYTLVHHRVISRSLDPIEKKPLFHFQPGSTSYSIATVGCNLRCRFCQNWEISQSPKAKTRKAAQSSTPSPVCPQLEQDLMSIAGERITPREIVAAALHAGARSIAYTYTEPTIFYELASNTARVAREHGLKNIFVTNGFTSPEPIRRIAPLLDAANVDLKFFRNSTYQRITGARLEPILDAIRLYRDLGVWVEVTTLVIPGENDTDEELADIAQFIHSLGPEVPWHISRFWPAHEMQHVDVTPIETLRRACRIGKDAGLRYVYTGNVPGNEQESTRCPTCREMLIRRFGVLVYENRVRDDRCPECGAGIDGIDMNPPPER